MNHTLLKNNEIFGDDIVPYLLEVTLLDNSHSFLKAIETLQRIGITDKESTNTLFQVCHILHKRGKYYIVHYKMLELLDGFENTLCEQDIMIQNRVASLLQEWNILKVLSIPKENQSSLGAFKIIPHKDRAKWKLTPLYIRK